jgi:hypothetical protein
MYSLLAACLNLKALVRIQREIIELLPLPHQHLIFAFEPRVGCHVVVEPEVSEVWMGM